MRTLRVEDAAYLAGAIDGEGCISIYQDRRPKKGGCTARVQITNTNREWLERFQKQLGAGKISTRGNGARAKQLSYLWFTRPETEALLPQIRPFLLIKGQQADLVTQYFAITDALQPLNFRRDDPKRATLLAQRAEVIATIQRLNRKGDGTPRVLPPPVAPRKCAIKQCTGKHFCKGYCRPHYRRYVEFGGPVWLERDCERCGKPFVARRKTRLFCSKACNHAAWMALHRDEQVAAHKAARHARKKSSP